MELKIADSIYQLRKEHHMTQEQLAAALGVTFAAVSKWERGISVPELRYIADMAGFFGVSMDVLSGYKITENRSDGFVEAIHRFTREKKYAEAISETEKAILRFPNHFSVVYYGAKAYIFSGMERKDAIHLRRAIELFRKANLLLSENHDPLISEVTIQSWIAKCYISLGEKDTALDILKRYNAGGIHNAIIGLNLSQDKKTITESAIYLQQALKRSISETINILMGYLNFYENSNDIENMLYTADFGITYLNALKSSEYVGMTFVDRFVAVFLCIKGILLRKAGKSEEASSLISQALELSEKYDAEPEYGMKGLLFTLQAEDSETSYDDMGESVKDILLDFLENE